MVVLIGWSRASTRANTSWSSASSGVSSVRSITVTAALRFSPGKRGVTGLVVVVASTSVTWVLDTSVVLAAVIVVVNAGAGAGDSSKAGAGAGVSLGTGARVSTNAGAGAGVSTNAGAVAGRSTGANVGAGVSILSWADCCTGSDDPELAVLKKVSPGL